MSRVDSETVLQVDYSAVRVQILSRYRRQEAGGREEGRKRANIRTRYRR